MRKIISNVKASESQDTQKRLSRFRGKPSAHSPSPGSGESRFALGLERFKKQGHLQAMVIPGILFLLVFMYIPMIGISIAFLDYKITLGYFKSPFAGLKYFQQVFTDPLFYRAFKNTFLLSLYGILLGFPAPILLALVLNEIPSVKYKRTIQTCSYLPNFISYVVVASMWILFLSKKGLVNQFLGSLRLIDTPIEFWMTADYWRLLATGVNVWKGVGWGAIVYLAAIAGISEELYEAAVIDGAGRLRRIWSITIPNLSNIVSVLLILSMGGLVRSSLDTSYLLGNLFTRDVSYVVEYYTLEMGLELGRYSFSTAVGVIQSVLALTLVLLANWTSGKLTGKRIF